MRPAAAPAHGPHNSSSTQTTTTDSLSDAGVSDVSETESDASTIPDEEDTAGAVAEMFPVSIDDEEEDTLEEGHSHLSGLSPTLQDIPSPTHAQSMAAATPATPATFIATRNTPSPPSDIPSAVPVSRSLINVRDLPTRAKAGARVQPFLSLCQSVADAPPASFAREPDRGFGSIWCEGADILRLLNQPKCWLSGQLISVAAEAYTRRLIYSPDVLSHYDVLDVSHVPPVERNYFPTTTYDNFLGLEAAKRARNRDSFELLLNIVTSSLERVSCFGFPLD